MQLTFMDPGKLRTPLELQRPNKVTDGQGGFSKIWETIGTVFAHVEPIVARQDLSGRTTQATITHRVIIRYRNDISNDLRFARDERLFNIVSSFDVDETRRYLVCNCEEFRP